MLTWLTDKPNEDPNVRGDAFKTLMVARLSYDADERDLEKEFGRYGPIERVCNGHQNIAQPVTDTTADSYRCRYSRS
jgi:RNA recognition motif-containing protein